MRRKNGIVVKFVDSQLICASNNVCSNNCLTLGESFLEQLFLLCSAWIVFISITLCNPVWTCVIYVAHAKDYSHYNIVTVIDMGWDRQATRTYRQGHCYWRFFKGKPLKCNSDIFFSLTFSTQRLTSFFWWKGVQPNRAVICKRIIVKDTN